MNYRILINKNNKIKENFNSLIKLCMTKDIENNNVLVEDETLKAYRNLEQEMLREKIIIGIASAYRTLEEQQQIIDDFKIKYGEEFTSEIVAPLGTSEHHTGLAIDISIMKDGKYIIDNNELYKLENDFDKIHKKIAKFGFILRYPKGKEKITGYNYEPWHLRYVQKNHAEIIYKKKITLEEYNQMHRTK